MILFFDTEHLYYPPSCVSSFIILLLIIKLAKPLSLLGVLKFSHKAHHTMTTTLIQALQTGGQIDKLIWRVFFSRLKMADCIHLMSHQSGGQVAWPCTSPSGRAGICRAEKQNKLKKKRHYFQKKKQFIQTEGKTRSASRRLTAGGWNFAASHCLWTLVKSSIDYTIKKMTECLHILGYLVNFG